MYSPKINEEFIPVLYRLAKEKKKPMTFVVNEIIAASLSANQKPTDVQELKQREVIDDG